MRTTRFLLVATASLLLGGCGLFGGGGGAPPADAPALDGLLRLSDEAMRALRSLRAETRAVPSVAGNPPYESAIELRGRRCIRNERSVREPDPSGRCPCGFVELAYEYEAFFARAEGGLNLGPPGGGTAPANLRLAGLEAIDSRAAWVVTYEFKTPSIEGPFTIRRKEWIDRESLLLLRQEQWDDDPFGVRAHVTTVLSGFDALPADACR